MLEYSLRMCAIELHRDCYSITHVACPALNYFRNVEVSRSSKGSVLLLVVVAVLL